MATTKIEWATDVWNPVVGCTYKSEGCRFCYAATMTRRLEAMGQTDYAGLTTAKHFNGTVRTLPHKLDIPLRWKKPRRVFVNSMSDLFHQDVPDDFLHQAFAVMERCPQHTFQVLTKRAERMAEYVGWRWGKRDDGPGHRIPSRNIWLGVSVERQQEADERIPWLLKTPAAVRFLSCEPLLGTVNLTQFLGDNDDTEKRRRASLPSGLDGRTRDRQRGANLAGSCAPMESVEELHGLDSLRATKGRKALGQIPSGSGDDWPEAIRGDGSQDRMETRESTANTTRPNCEPQRRQLEEQPPGQPRIGNLRRTDGASDSSDRARSETQLGAISWVIVGGESGHHARPMHVEWASSIVEQCQAAGVACFVKQLGAFPVNGEPCRPPNGTPFWTVNDRLKLADKKGGDIAEWPAELRVREFPQSTGATHV